MKPADRLLLLWLVLLLASPALAGEGKVMGRGLADFDPAKHEVTTTLYRMDGIGAIIE
jgi:hypothetical protein